MPYRPRIAGTASKLRAFRDGRRILVTILKLGLRLRPGRMLLMGVIPMIALGIALHPAFAAAAGLYALILWSAYLAEFRSSRLRTGSHGPGTVDR